MKLPLAYEEVAETLALYIYNVWYREEQRVDLPPIRTFDNRLTSALQVSAGVLTKLKIIEPIDSIGRRSVFVCVPSCFRKRAVENKANGCSFDTLVLAVIRVAEYSGPREARLLECLIELGLCEPVLFKTKTLKPGSVTVEIPDFSLNWTQKRDRYDRLGADWPALIQ